MNGIRLPDLTALRTRLSTQHAPGWGRWAELLVFALAIPLLGHVISPADPLGLSSGFPWVAVGPCLFAARYGVPGGFACVCLAALAVLAHMPMYAGQTSSVVTLALGSVVLAVLIGDAASAWRRRGLRAEAENVYLKHRLKEFSNDYHVLKVSHGQLEEFMAGRRLSLRQALLDIEPALTSGGESLGSGSDLMAVFAQFCSVQVAGLYALKSDSLIDENPVAVHGDMGDLPMFDPLLRLALSEQKLVSVRLDSVADNHHADGLLAVVPITDSRGHTYGVLAIRDMHFMAFQQENLNILALLAGYVGDRIARAGGFGDTPANRFVAELDTALRFAHSHDVRSALLMLKLRPGQQTSEVAEFVAGTRRSLDSAWIPPQDSSGAGTTVVLLLPLVGERGARRWVMRVEDQVADTFGLSLEQLLVAEELLVLDGSQTRIDCLALIQGLAVDAPAEQEAVNRVA